MSVPATTGPERAPRSDAELVLSACHGDADAWEAIVDRHLGMVNRIARSYGLPRQDHEDAVQTVWLRLNQNLPRLHSPHLLAAWLSRAAHTACGRQRQHRRRLLPVDPLTLAEHLHHPTDPEHEYLLKERHAELHRAIGELTDPVDRRVARHYLDDSPDARPISHRTTPNQRRHLLRQLRRSLRATREPNERRA
ncbi:hypothetical protein GCM10007079_37560 [Nocardiopsis terrae]|uniref:RNA polymerase sigma factor (Sigma-70 family) n=1 Tax=Nocardiopsis terrae TaxID=372655 RepID=A0ABR9HDN8_9ACTN|nr:sigma-70 family RNA polymerase sigma factor [Nocardiopsis terrae]MBE1457146.1 RNA polymerase sigma factor (sigma-70 family) [Nocardiopsis terrae]GHC90878.1 hypothetical protein GCM10007079_37560 [Nocardiopsis terrae]